MRAGRSRVTARMWRIQALTHPFLEHGKEAAMKSPVVKRSIVIGGHKTSVSLEEAFWDGMKEISRERGKTLSELVSEIDDRRQQGNLSSAIRLFVLDHFRTGAAGPADVAIAQGSSPDGSGGKSAGEVRNPAGRTYAPGGHHLV
jgi:predicted DNA-binding ribbon-helix-helix protein